MFQIKYSFNEIHDLKIPKWSLRNYEERNYLISYLITFKSVII